jgi:hypothetical protein
MFANDGAPGFGALLGFFYTCFVPIWDASIRLSYGRSLWRDLGVRARRLHPATSLVPSMGVCPAHAFLEPWN